MHNCIKLFAISLGLTLSNICSVYGENTILQVHNESIVINNRAVQIIKISQPNGTWGYTGKQGESFNVTVENKLSEPTVLHWHGLILPNNQDGTEMTQAYIPSGGSYTYHYPLTQAGTFFMHSHYELQEQLLASAPFIVYPANATHESDIVIMFHDFSFTPPQKILSQLTGNQNPVHHSMAMTMESDEDSMNMNDMDMSNMEHMDSMNMDLNDVKYDAFLTNLHTTQAPEIHQIAAGTKIRLRFINAASSSNFWINLGKLKGTLIAVDGSPVKPIIDNKFQIAIAQRLDIEVTLPKTGGIFPIIGQVEGLKNQTGLILTTHKYHGTIPELAKTTAPALNYTQELRLSSISLPNLPKIDKSIDIKIGGNMKTYSWTINNQAWPKITPIKLSYGKTYQFNFINQTMMSHPMHLHGYTFHIVEINGKKFNGADRDTVLVEPNSNVKVIFTANAKGKWMLHCHNMYHMPTGMMTYIDVE